MTEQEKYLAYLKALKKPFQKLCRLRFLNPDGSTAFFVDNSQKNRYSGAFIAEGTLTVNLQNGVRRTASVTLSNMDGAFDYNVNRVWFGQEIALDEGLVLPSGEDYYIQQGVFLLETPKETVEPGKRTATYELVDKWANLDGTLWGKLDGLYRGELNVNIFQQIDALLQDDKGNGRKVDPVAPVYTEYYNGGVHFISADAPPKGSDWYDVASDGKNGAVAIGILTGVTKDGGNTWGQLGYSFSRKAAITYGDGVYIVLDAGTVYRSADGGYTWTRTNLGSEWVGADSYCAAYGDGTFLLLCASEPPRYANSTDGGVTWTQGTTDHPQEYPMELVYVGGGSFLAGGKTTFIGGPRIFVTGIRSNGTSNGHTLLYPPQEKLQYPVLAAQNGRGFLFVPGTNRAYWSDDLQNWVSIDLPETGIWSAASYSVDTLTVFRSTEDGGAPLCSQDAGRTWSTAAVQGTGAGVSGAAALNDDAERYITVNGTGALLRGEGGRAQQLADGTLQLLTNAPYTLEVEPGSGTYAGVVLGFAEMLNAWVGYDSTGRLRIDPSQDDLLDGKKPISYAFSMEETTLLGLTYTAENTEVYNDYIVMGAALDDNSQPGARAYNNDPMSDTNVQLIGRKTIWTEEDGYATERQCADRAAWELKRSAVLQKSVNISCAQILHLVENTLVTVARTDKPGAPVERHLVTGFVRPLSGSGAMTISATSVADFPAATITTWPLKTHAEEKTEG